MFTKLCCLAMAKIRWEKIFWLIVWHLVFSPFLRQPSKDATACSITGQDKHSGMAAPLFDHITTTHPKLTFTFLKEDII